MYYAVRQPDFTVRQTQLIEQLERLYHNAFGEDCDPIDEYEFNAFTGSTPVQFLDGQGERAMELNRKELGTVDFSQYSTTAKRCCYISQSAWPQKAVVHTLHLYPVQDITNDERNGSFYLEVQYDDYKKPILRVFEDYSVICAPLNYLSKYDTVQKLADLLHSYAYQGYSGHRRQLEEAMRKDNGYVNLADIRIAELVGEPAEYVDKLKQFRQRKVEQRQQEQQAAEQLREQEKVLHFEARKKELQDMVESAKDVIRKGGTIKNALVYVPQSVETGLNTTLILFLMKQSQINVPLKTQGWINNALLSADFVEQKCKRLILKRNAAKSKVIFQYLEQLAAAVCAEETAA